MSSFIPSEPTSNLESRRRCSLSPYEDSFGLDRRNGRIVGKDASSNTFARLQFFCVWFIRTAFMILGIVTLPICISQYDPTHQDRASQDSISSFCVHFQQNECALRIYLPHVLLDPPGAVFVTSVLGFLTLVLTSHGIRREDKYQDQILAFGTICGSILCGVWASQRGDLAPFKNIMPGIISASLAASATFHTVFQGQLERKRRGNIARDMDLGMGENKSNRALKG